ncbi:MAG: polysaccharide deacetylase family protein [Hyphomicrobium sp.]
MAASDGEYTKSGPDRTAPPSCASDPDKLGLSRVVEIDSAGGPEFGGKEGQRHDFLADREVILTFDDGPVRAYTRRVLAALAAQCTRATFFMVGRMAVADPAMVREVADQGHTVATHTWSHKNLSSVGAARAEQEFELGVSAVQHAARGAAAPFFRFPYLSESPAILDRAEKRGIATFWIDVDSKDYLTRSALDVQRRIMAQLNAKGKGIILMHDIQPSTVGAISSLLEELRRRGFKVVHVIPKAPLTTISDYDAAAERAFGAKSKALKQNPLADRSVVWPADQNGEARATAAPAGDELPWLEPTPTGKSSVRRKRTQKASDDPSSQFQPFGF